MIWNIIKALAALAALVIGVLLVIGTTTDDEIITSQVCSQETCVLSHQHSSREYTMEYYSELNLNSSCDDIKNYIITNLEEINPSAFHSSDDTPITDTMKKELIFVLENRSDMIRKDNDITSPGIKFIFCCPDEHQCIINGD